MAASETIAAEPRRFSIRLPRPLWIFLATVLLVIIGVGLHIGIPIYRQQMAIREIKRLGGSVQTSPRGAEWVRRRLGDERMTLWDDVIRIDLNNTQATDSTLCHFVSLSHLERLELDGTQVTDTGLAHLIELQNLERLHVYRTEITDAGLEHLARLKNLKVLSANGTHVTADGVSVLKQALPDCIIVY